MLAIETRNLTRRFGDFVAVNQTSIKVEKGEVFGFLGPNGSGKTTVIKMLTGILVPSGGHIMIDGRVPHQQRVGRPRAHGFSVAREHEEVVTVQVHRMN